MVRRLQLLSVLLAWLLASGSQWDLVQVTAWGKMFVEYSRSMSLSTAVKKTFSGEMCSLCKTVNEAKKAEASPEIAYGSKAKSLALHTPEPIIFSLAPEAGFLRPSACSSTGVWRSSPPTPPPRGVLHTA